MSNEKSVLLLFVTHAYSLKVLQPFLAKNMAVLARQKRKIVTVTASQSKVFKTWHHHHRRRWVLFAVQDSASYYSKNIYNLYMWAVRRRQKDAAVVALHDFFKWIRIHQSQTLSHIPSQQKQHLEEKCKWMHTWENEGWSMKSLSRKSVSFRIFSSVLYENKKLEHSQNGLLLCII